MSAPLSLVRLRPDLAILTRWGLERNYLPKGSDADLGYCLHAALKEGLGDLAPRPFVLRQDSRASVGTRRADEILGYVGATPETMQDAASIPAVHSTVTTVLNLPSLEARAMPQQWHRDARLSFEVRVRPVVRSRRAGRRGSSHEVDIAAWHAQRSDELSRPRTAREKVYRDWLAERFDSCGARLLNARIIAMRRTRVRRRPTIDTKRQTRDVEGPDILFRGELVVADSESFSKGLVQGLGRHSAFGFGCLLLAPPGAFA